MEINTIKKNAAVNILALVPLILFLAACSSKEKGNEYGEDKSKSVKTEIVSSAPISDSVTYSGNVEGTTTVKLGFMVPGKINQIARKVGQFVSKGQLIATLETTNYALNKQLADVQLKETADEYQRLKLLHSRGSLSESDFSKMGFTLEKAQVQQQLEVKNLKDTRLYTPIDGILLSRQAEPGEIIAAGTPLFEIADIRRVSVLAFIPEGELSGLRIGQNASINIASLSKVFKGKITELGAIADAASRAFTIKIMVENNSLQIRPGMIATATIPIKALKTSIRLPAECIINDLGNQSYVYVVDKPSQKAFKRKVSLGKMMLNNIEILSGLSVGETVIVSGQTKLSDGALIRIEK